MSEWTLGKLPWPGCSSLLGGVHEVVTAYQEVATKGSRQELSDKVSFPPSWIIGNLFGRRKPFLRTR